MALQADNGVWSLMRRFFLQPARLARWCVVSFVRSDRLSQQDVHEFIASLKEALTDKGNQLPSGVPTVIYFLRGIKPVVHLGYVQASKMQHQRLWCFPKIVVVRTGSR